MNNRSNENNMNVNRTKQNSTLNIRWMLVRYDLIVYAVVSSVLLVLYGGMDELSTEEYFNKYALCTSCIFVDVLLVEVTGRYGDMVGYNVISGCCLPILLLFVAYPCLELLLPVQKLHLPECFYLSA